MNASIIIDKIKAFPIAVASVLLLLLLVVAIFMRSGVADELSITESELNSRIRVIDKNIKSSNDIEQNTEDLKLIVEEMDSRLFSRYERAVNISFFYTFENLADVVISNISQLSQSDPIYDKDGPRSLTLHSTLVFNISLSGSFEDILKFCYEIQEADSLIRIADFQVSRSGNELGGANMEAQLRVLAMAKKN
jgi:Tfp pilus assembly protein PilO